MGTRLKDTPPGEISQLIDGPLSLPRDRQILLMCYEACRNRVGYASTVKVHQLYQEAVGSKEPYDGYLYRIYKILHRLGVIKYYVRGYHGWVSMTPKGKQVIESLKVRA